MCKQVPPGIHLPYSETEVQRLTRLLSEALLREQINKMRQSSEFQGTQNAYQNPFVGNK
jgi:hypothetical protein